MAKFSDVYTEIIKIPEDSDESSLLETVLSEEINRFKNRSSWKFIWIRRLSIIFLASAILITVVGIVVWTIVIKLGIFEPKVAEFPVALIAIGSSALGAIAGILAPISKE